MKNNWRIFLCCSLFLYIGINISFSQLRWDSLGQKTNTLYSQGINVLYADSNYLYAAGRFNRIAGIHAQGIARWNGSKWDTMGGGIDALNYHDTLPGSYPDNTWAIINYHSKLYVAGDFFSLGSVWSVGLGTWNGVKWDSLPVQPQTAGDALAVINDKLYMGGGFNSVANIPCNGIACWNDTNWSSLNFPHFSSWQSISAICEYKGDIYAGGHFAGNNGAIGNIMRLDSAGWHAVDTGIKGASAWITCMAIYNGELYVAGYFFKSDGNAGNCIQKWNGASWSDVGGGINYEVFNLMVYHRKLYAMGELTGAGGISASKIAEWDGTKWCSLGSTFQNTITSACEYKDSLYVGGAFRTINGDSINYVAEWTGGDYTANCSQPAGISEINNKGGKVEAYPNPSNGNFTITFSHPVPMAIGVVSGSQTIEVYNILGERIYNAMLNQVQHDYQIDLSKQANGIYLYRVINETGNLVGEGKLIIQK